MKLPDFRNHEELNKLRELMGAQYIPDIEKKLIDGITIKQGEVKPDSDGTLLYRREHVVLYIRDWYGENDWNRYHIVNCKWIQEMQREGRYSRYVCAKPKNGQFSVNRPNHPESELLNLSICKFCLEKLELRNIFKPNEFPLSDWFDAIDDGYEPRSIEPIDRIKSEENYYIAAWRFLSWLCRKNANWECQQCTIALGTERYDRRFLHAHHIRGTRYNRLEDLIALCIGCHAEQDGEKHENLKSSDVYKEFMDKYGDAWRELSAKSEKTSDNQFQPIDLDDEQFIPF